MNNEAGPNRAQRLTLLNGLGVHLYFMLSALTVLTGLCVHFSSPPPKWQHPRSVWESS
jgi:hypothetical protein